MSAVTAHVIDRGKLWDELRAGLIDLGLTPSGPYSTVKARLDALDGNIDISDHASWTSFANAGLTVGNAAYTARYVQVGPIVVANLALTLGTTSAVTGNIVLNLPVTADTARFVQGSGFIVDDSGPIRYPVIVESSGTTTTSIRIGNASITYTTNNSITSTVPFTWATGDSINVGLFYLAA
jgi:hypothetical protein